MTIWQYHQMPKQKKSFFERLTGIKKIETDENETRIPMRNGAENRQNYITEYESREESYEFPPSYDQTRQEEEYFQPEAPAPAEKQQQPHQMVTTDLGGSESEGQLTIDVYQTDDDIVIKSTIAGVKPEDLDVNINNDMVTIRGERKQEEEVDQENYYYQECYWGPFSRSVILPVEIVAEKAEATMKNGILTIRLPKADTTKTRKIQVRGF